MLMRKNIEEEGSTDVPRSHDERPNIQSKYTVNSYCFQCRYHFQVHLSFPSPQEDAVICDLADASSPMHHFRLLKSMKGKDWEEYLGSEDFKYDPLTEAHQFACTAPNCPAQVDIRISPPRLPTKLLAPVTDAAKLYQRGRIQIQADPTRFDGDRPVSVSTALCFFRTYLCHVKADEGRRIAKRNKKYSLAFGDECESLFEYVGFEGITVDSDTEVCIMSQVIHLVHTLRNCDEDH
jgi:ubiquitin carboxyl-terminal hydrolase 25/28